MSTLTAQVTDLLRSRFALTEITPAAHAQMKYPKYLPMMRFTVHQYRAEGFGHFMTMETKAMGGLMRLSTLVFTPGEGANVPFLLIDTMDMKKKRLAYVEYYDCTAEGASLPESENQAAEFAQLPDYAETPAWYVERRTPYSLIKGGAQADPEALARMVLTCAERYARAAAAAPKNAANLAGLRAFQRDMIEKGNPSSGAMSKVLGADGAKEFFKNVIMKI